MRSTTIVSLLFASWALISRKGMIFICEWIKLSCRNQNPQLLTLLQFRLKLTRLGQSATVSTRHAG
jgi:hypothetical protein